MKTKPLQIGITGGIGSGKSLICHIFRILKIPVYDADSRAKWLLTNDALLKEAVKDQFGTEVYDAGGTLNREYLAAKVFNDSDAVQRLNALVHPRVAQDYQQWTGKYTSAAYLLKEAALLFESGSYKTLDKVITVFAPEAVRIRRVLKRDPQRTPEQVKSIIKKQYKDEKRAQLTDYRIDNDGSRLVISQVLEIHDSILSLKGSAGSKY